MADVQARVVTGSGGEVTLYLFSDEKTDGGASLRYARVSVEDGEILLMTATREPEDRWPTEPDVGRVAHGVSSGVDLDQCIAQFNTLGNAVVPQVAEVVGRVVRSMAEQV